MNYKLIAIDMDGTLLNSAHEVSEENKKALKLAEEKGVKVVISTGRIFTSARYYAKLLGLDAPIIACNGAYVCEYDRSNVLLENPISLEDLRYIIEVFEKNNMYYHFYDHENFYSRRLDYNSLKYNEWNEKQKPENRINLKVLDNPLDFIEKNKPQIYKLVIMDKDFEKLAKVKSILRKNQNVEIVSSWRGSFDIMSKGVSKGNALKELCKLFNIDRSQVIAIGDNENDISMLEFAGKGVAMGNGEEEVKAIADIITDTNDNHGVGKAIEQLLGKTN